MKKIITNDLLEKFKQHLYEEEKSIATVEKYYRDVKKFQQYIQDNEVTKEMTIEYQQKLLNEKYAISSINSMLASINSLFAFVGWSECMVKNYKVQREVFCTKEKELSKEEYMRLVNTAQRRGNVRLYLLLQTICATGMRVSELSNITVESVDRGMVSVNSKGKIRTVFLVSELQKKLMRYARKAGIKCGEIFITRSGKYMSRTNIWREMKSLCEEAGVDKKKVFPHNLRHLFARTFYAIKKTSQSLQIS